jgi:hypothetical protein
MSPELLEFILWGVIIAIIVGFVILPTIRMLVRGDDDRKK